MLRLRVFAVIIVVAITYSQVIKRCSWPGVRVVWPLSIAVVASVVPATVVTAVGVVVALICRRGIRVGESLSPVALVLIMSRDPTGWNRVREVVSTERQFHDLLLLLVA